MTRSAIKPLQPSGLRPILDHLEREHFPASRLTEARPGQVAAQFFASRLTSAFQPVMRAAGGIAGHHALLRVFDESGEAIAPWGVFAQAARDPMLVQLDRLTRTVHAVNYFPREDPRRILFLNVEERLLRIVADNHGAYFELILRELGIAPKRVAIVLPPGVLDDPVTFVRAAIAYRLRGYRVVAQLHSAAEADLEHIFLADPHYVALDVSNAGDRSHIDAGCALAPALIDALRRRGIHAIACRVESEAQAQAARDAGFDFLQGRHFA
jgi:EAL domain-containing protein (putative c-di-GMP-specific phosphodiesterase class I)